MRSGTLVLLVAAAASACHGPSPSAPTSISSQITARTASVGIFSGTWTGQSKVLSAGALPCHPPGWEVGSSEDVAVWVSQPLPNFDLVVEVSEPLVAAGCRLQGRVQSGTLTATGIDLGFPVSSLPFDTCEAPLDTSKWNCAEASLALSQDGVELFLELDDAQADQVRGTVKVDYRGTVLTKALSLTRKMGQ